MLAIAAEAIERAFRGASIGGGKAPLWAHFTPDR